MAVLATLLWRLPSGIDLYDESYSAQFVDDWLKGGLATSKFATLHQTASLIVYPAAKAYFAGADADGLLLFLRVCFLVGAVLTALAWWALLVRLEAAVVAWLGASVVLAFIPFSLPSITYNTLGLQGLFVALAGLGIARLAGSPRSREAGTWIFISALGWAVSTVAYPTMVVPLGACLALLLAERDWEARWRYVAWVGAAQVLAWGVVCAAFFGRMLESVIYLAALNDVGAASRKLNAAAVRLQAGPRFTASCVAAVCVGLLRPWIPPVALCILTVGLVVSVCVPPAALYMLSHDVIAVVALTGIGLLWNRRVGDRKDRVLAMIWSVSALAGFVTAATAKMVLTSFSIGAAPAAAAALAGLPLTARRARRAGLFVYAVVLIAVAVSTVTFIYPYGYSVPFWRLQRIDSGAFAGLWAHREEVKLLALIQERVAPLAGRDNTIALFGVPNGLLLATPARSSALAPWVLHADLTNPKALRMAEAFYDKPENRPGVALIYHNARLPHPFNPMETNFSTWYEPVFVLDTTWGDLEVYRKR